MTGEEMAKELSNFVNSLSSRRRQKEFCETLMREHRTLQQSVFGLFSAAIREWAKQENFDARNEFTIKTCKKIVSSVDDINYNPPLI